MNDMTPTAEQRTAKLEGMGCKRKRVEDIRFVQGKGNYVDDVKMPNMLYGDFNRSPYAHALLRAIEVSAALAAPGVVSVWTAADIADLPPIDFRDPANEALRPYRQPLLARR